MSPLFGYLLKSQESRSVLAQILASLCKLETTFNYSIQNKRPKILKNRTMSTTAKLVHLIDQDPSIKFLRLQWLDLTSSLRLRIVPVDRFLQLFNEGKPIGVPKYILGLLHKEFISPGFDSNGQCNLIPDFDSLRIGARDGYATVQCDFQELDGNKVSECPRTLLQDIVNEANSKDIEFLVGFEIEVVFTKWAVVDGEISYPTANNMGYGHSYSSATVLHDDHMMSLVEAIFLRCERAGISIQHFHPESCPGQFEFVLPAMRPLAAVDTLIATRDIISTIAARFSMRATFYPKPYPEKVGTGEHIHLSLTPPGLHEMFFAGVLKHLRAIIAFTYPNAASYDRASDSTFSGSTWVSWGTENRESPVRRIDGSHYEIRCADGFANMYLALSAILGAGVLGVTDHEPLTMKDCPHDPAKISQQEREALGIREKIPASLEESLQCLREDSQMRAVLGTSFVEKYLLLKEAEKESLESMDPVRRRCWLMERY